MGFIRQKSLFSRRAVNKLIELYAKKDNWHNIDKNKGNLGYGWFHYSLIRILQPKRILVIGSRYGYIPAICAVACKDNNKGRVDFVDAGYDFRKADHRKHWGGIGFWKKIKPAEHFGKFSLERHISGYIMTSYEFSKKHPQRLWGYINIDGDHSYEGVKFDFETFWPRLEKGGFLSLHDIY